VHLRKKRRARGEGRKGWYESGMCVFPILLYTCNETRRRGIRGKQGEQGGTQAVRVERGIFELLTTNTAAAPTPPFLPCAGDSAGVIWFPPLPLPGCQDPRPLPPCHLPALPQEERRTWAI